MQVKKVKTMEVKNGQYNGQLGFALKETLWYC